MATFLKHSNLKVMKVPHSIIGADLSKESIDFACPLTQSHLKVENSDSGFKTLVQWLADLKIITTELMIVMEHTGVYSWKLERFLHDHQISFTKVPALAIKRSLGLVRGKNDKVDALRIARYGFEKRDKLVAAQKTDSAVERLQLLHATRERLVRHRAALICALKECAPLLEKSDPIILSQQSLIENFSQQIDSIDEQIGAQVKKDAQVCKNFELLTSIKGVGKVVAVAAIIKTKNFSCFASARKFACYCGTAPFEHASGKSLRRKSRISHLADKTMKTLLDLAAKSAIQCDEEIRQYYQRRIQAGKSKKSTINVVRNKLLYRMFAVVKRSTPYQPLPIAA